MKFLEINFSHLKNLHFYLSAILLALLPFHALLTTLGGAFLGSTSDFLPQSSLILSSWKEILIVILGFFFLSNWWKQKKFPITFYTFDWIFISFTIIAILSGLITQDLGQIIWGLKYDFSFWALFYIIRGLNFSDQQKQTLLNTFVISAGVVISWGLIQYFLLPKNFLLSLGYSEHVSSFNPDKPVAMYHLLGGTDIARMASTFSGPNQFGFYLVAVFAYVFTQLGKVFTPQTKLKNLWNKLTSILSRKRSSDFLSSKRFLLTFAFLTGTCLILTFSRSAWLAAFTLGIIFLLTSLPKQLCKKFFAGLLGLGIIASLFIGIFFQNTVKQTLLRAESSGGHYERSKGAFLEVIEHPLGTGIGTAGPASVRDESLHTVKVHLEKIKNLEAQGLTLEARNHIWLYDHGEKEVMDFKPKNTTELKKIPSLQIIPEEIKSQIFTLWEQNYHERIAENWHLQMFQEFGWLGGFIWLALLFYLLKHLWSKKENTFALTAFYGILGLSIAGLFLHSFEDSSTSLTLFLLAGLAFKE